MGGLHFEEPGEAIQYVHKKKIVSIDLKYVDLLGRWRHVTLPASRVSTGLFDEGVGFDASSVQGYGSVSESDMCILPDQRMAFRDPFWEQPTLSFLCNVVEADTKRPFNRCPRTAAQRAEAYLHSLDLAEDALFSPEYEFHLFDAVRHHSDKGSAFYHVASREASWSEETGEQQAHAISEKCGYHASPPEDQLFRIRDDMVATLSEIGVQVKYHHHEGGGPGQVEIEVGFDSLVRTADQGMMIKYVVKNVAARNGLSATFMPKPLFGLPGNGLHIHQFLTSGGNSLFYGKGSYADLSPLGVHYIGGLLEHGKSLVGLVSPSTNSFKRLVPGYEAPVSLFYSVGNRNAAIRIPRYAAGPEDKRIEFRISDATGNIYLTLAAMLMAGIDGIRRNLEPVPPPENAAQQEPAGAEQISRTLGEALVCLETDYAFLLEGDVFSEDLIRTWIQLKWQDVDEVGLRPHPWEFELYYDV